MVTLIKQLIARGHAYEAGGEVLFDTASMPDYGKLSGRSLTNSGPGRESRSMRQEESGRFRIVEAIFADENPAGKGHGAGAVPAGTSNAGR